MIEPIFLQETPEDISRRNRDPVTPDIQLIFDNYDNLFITFCKRNPEFLEVLNKRCFKNKSELEKYDPNSQNIDKIWCPLVFFMILFLTNIRNKWCKCFGIL